MDSGGQGQQTSILHQTIASDTKPKQTRGESDDKAIELTDNHEQKLNPLAYTFTPMTKASEGTSASDSNPIAERQGHETRKTIETDRDRARDQDHEEIQSSSAIEQNRSSDVRSPVPDPKPAKESLSFKEYDNASILQNLIRVQTEYLFSDYHLTNDTYLLARMSENVDQWISVKEILRNPKIRCLTNQMQRVVNAIKESEYLELSHDKEFVRRPDLKLPDLKPNRDLRRSIFLFGIAPLKSKQDLIAELSEFGVIKRIHLEEPHDPLGPIREVAILIMKKKFLFPSHHYLKLGKDLPDAHRKKLQLLSELYAHPIPNPNGDETDFSHLKSCFVVFASQSQATKCVKSRARAVDGMRCVHKYDYTKVAKKFNTAKMKGETLNFSPQLHSNILNELQSNFLLPVKDVTGAEEYYGTGSVRIKNSSYASLERFRKARSGGRSRSARQSRHAVNAQNWSSDTSRKILFSTDDSNYRSVLRSGSGNGTVTSSSKDVRGSGISGSSNSANSDSQNASSSGSIMKPGPPSIGYPNMVFNNLMTPSSVEIPSENVDTSTLLPMQSNMLPPQLHHPLQSQPQLPTYAQHPDLLYDYPESSYDMYMGVNPINIHSVNHIQVPINSAYNAPPVYDDMFPGNVFEQTAPLYEYVERVPVQNMPQSAPFRPVATRQPQFYVQLQRPQSNNIVLVQDVKPEEQNTAETVLSVMSNNQ